VSARIQASSTPYIHFLVSGIVIVHRKGAKCTKVLFFGKYMLKISEKPCDFIVEDTPSLKFFIIFIVFSLRPLRLCGGLNWCPGLISLF